MNRLKRNDFFLSFLTMIWIICFAVTFTVFFKSLYYMDIHWLGIDHATSLSMAEIKHNYDVLIRYQSIFYRGDLVLPNFVMSESGIKHFKEVKVIFDIVQGITMAGLVVIIPAFVKKYKERDFLYFKYSSYITIGLPSIVGLLASIDFSKAFVLFHQIVFRNNDWIFDERYDPVITILPEQFFMHCFILIILIVLLLSAVYFVVYKRLFKGYAQEIKE